MITTSTAAFVVESGSQEQFNGSTIYVMPQYDELTTTFVCKLRIQDTATTNFIAEGRMEVTKAEVDAETGSGTGETAPWFDALQKAVKTKLSAMTGNASVTFTIV